MAPESIRLFIKPGCPWCEEATDWLDEHGLQYEVLDVIQDTNARDEMQELSGQSRAPVIEVDGKVLADFGGDELEEWWERMRFGI